MLIYHLAEPHDWDAKASSYTAASLETEGFIHCSTDAQLPGVAATFYADRDDIIVLTIDPGALSDTLVFEDLYDHGDEFPHIYGPIPITAITSAQSLDEWQRANHADWSEEDVRLAIYRMLASTGAAPTEAEMAQASGMSLEGVSAAYDRLADQRHIVLDGDRNIVLAHPFATINVGFSVMGTDTLWWGGCVWDSFAIPHLLPTDDSVLVATTCQGCGTPHSWVVTNEAPPEGDQIAHFLTPMASVWDDVVRTCSNQRVFCNEGCLDAWLAASGLERGYVADLATVWRLASRWYQGRLDSPYVRREPAEAKEYFRSVDLQGPFWGLD